MGQRKRKSVRDKILHYISKPRRGEWISAKSLAKYIREPLEHVEFYICALTDENKIGGVRECEGGGYWVKHTWQAGVRRTA